MHLRVHFHWSVIHSCYLSHSSTAALYF